MKKEKNLMDKPIDIIKIFSLIYHNQKFIVNTTILFFVIGIIYSLTLQNIYKSSSTFYPHYENVNESNDLQSLAGLAGINIQNTNTNNIPTNLYPELIKSSLFKFEILKKKVIYNKQNITYRDYLSLNNNFKLKDLISKSILLFKKNLINKKALNNINDLIYITQDDFILFRKIEDNIRIEINEEDGFIELSVYDHNPEISATIAIEANKILQKNIIDFKLKNLKDVYNFTDNQLNIAKRKLYKIQDSLANFKDSNIFIKSDLFLNKLNRLETEFSITKNLYNELALTKEKTAIDVRRNTPIFTIIDDVVVPNEKDSPSRTIIVFMFIFLGFSIAVCWIIIKKPIILIYKEIKIN